MFFLLTNLNQESTTTWRIKHHFSKNLEYILRKGYIHRKRLKVKCPQITTQNTSEKMENKLTVTIPLYPSDALCIHIRKKGFWSLKDYCQNHPKYAWGLFFKVTSQAINKYLLIVPDIEKAIFCSTSKNWCSIRRPLKYFFLRKKRKLKGNILHCIALHYEIVQKFNNIFKMNIVRRKSVPEHIEQQLCDLQICGWVTQQFQK